MISEGSCKDGSNDAENSALITEINVLFLYIHIKKTFKIVIIFQIFTLLFFQSRNGNLAEHN